MRTVCPQSNMEMVLSCRREHHVQDNICQHMLYKGNPVLLEAVVVCSVFS